MMQRQNNNQSTVEEPADNKQAEQNEEKNLKVVCSEVDKYLESIESLPVMKCSSDEVLAKRNSPDDLHDLIAVGKVSILTDENLKTVHNNFMSLFHFIKPLHYHRSRIEEFQLAENSEEAKKLLFRIKTIFSLAVKLQSRREELKQYKEKLKKIEREESIAEAEKLQQEIAAEKLKKQSEKKNAIDPNQVLARKLNDLLTRYKEYGKKKHGNEKAAVCQKYIKFLKVYPFINESNLKKCQEEFNALTKILPQDSHIYTQGGLLSFQKNDLGKFRKEFINTIDPVINKLDCHDNDEDLSDYEEAKKQVKHDVYIGTPNNAIDSTDSTRFDFVDSAGKSDFLNSINKPESKKETLTLPQFDQSRTWQAELECIVPILKEKQNQIKDFQFTLKELEKSKDYNDYNNFIKSMKFIIDKKMYTSDDAFHNDFKAIINNIKKMKDNNPWKQIYHIYSSIVNQDYKEQIKNHLVQAFKLTSDSSEENLIKRWCFKHIDKSLHPDIQAAYIDYTVEKRSFYNLFSNNKNNKEVVEQKLDFADDELEDLIKQMISPKELAEIDEAVEQAFDKNQAKKISTKEEKSELKNENVTPSPKKNVKKMTRKEFNRDKKAEHDKLNQDKERVITLTNQVAKLPSNLQAQSTVLQSTQAESVSSVARTPQAIFNNRTNTTQQIVRSTTIVSHKRFDVL